MTRATVLQEVRQMRFEELYARRQRGDLTMVEAAEMLGDHGADVSAVEYPLRSGGCRGASGSTDWPGLRPCSPGR